MSKSEHTANLLLQRGEERRTIPAWQVPSICKRKARGISVTHRIKKLLGI